MSDENIGFTEEAAEVKEVKKAAKRPETSEVKKALDAAKLADKREAQRKRTAVGQAIGKAYKNKGVIQQNDYRR